MSPFWAAIFLARLGFKYGPTVWKGWVVANNSPEIVAAWNAFIAGVEEFHAASVTTQATPSPPQPSIDPQVAVEALKSPVGPQPEGQSTQF